MATEYRDLYFREGTMAAVFSAGSYHKRFDFYTTNGPLGVAEDSGAKGFLDNNFDSAAIDYASTRHFLLTLDNDLNLQHPIGSSGIHFRAASAPTTADVDLILVDNNPGTRTAWPKLWWDYSSTAFVFGSSTNTEHLIINSGNLTLSDGNISVEGSAVFNSAGGANNFQVQSDGSLYAIYVDGTNDRVGILTNTPAAPLDVFGFATGFSGIFNRNGVDADFYISGDTKASLFYVDGGNDRVGINNSTPAAIFDCEGSAIFNNSQADYDFRIATLTYSGMFTVDAALNSIGMGTATPETFVHIKKGDAGGTPVFDTTNTVLTLENEFSLGTVLQLLCDDASFNSINFGSVSDVDNGVISYNIMSGFFTFKVNNVTNMLLAYDTGLNIGLEAVSTPAYLLQVNQDAGQTYLRQNSITGAKSPLILSQADESEEIIDFEANNLASGDVTVTEDYIGEVVGGIKIRYKSAAGAWTEGRIRIYTNAGV